MVAALDPEKIVWKNWTNNFQEKRDISRVFSIINIGETYESASYLFVSFVIITVDIRTEQPSLNVA